MSPTISNDDNLINADEVIARIEELKKASKRSKRNSTPLNVQLRMMRMHVSTP